MRKRKELTHTEVIAILKDRQGDRSLRQFAEDMRVSAAYLSDIYLGKRSIGPTVLKSLGLTKNVQTAVTYVATKEGVSA